MFEEFTEQYFLQQAKILGDRLGVDTRKGSVYMDMAAGHCLRAAFYFANLQEVFNMFAIDTCYGSVLDDKASEWGLERHPSSAAIFYATFIGAVPEIGDRFFAEDTKYYFDVIDVDGVLMLRAETEGAELNKLSAGTVVTPLDDIEDLEESYLGEIYTLGTDEETDDDFRARLREKIAGPAENGNKQHYKTWCESIDGVGRARIDPLFAGENTVRAVLYSPEGLVVTQEVVNAVQEFIDPITQGYTFTDAEGNEYVCGDGFGDGVANLGAHFLAVSASPLNITVSFNVTLTQGYNIEMCTQEATQIISEYLQSLVLDTEEGVEIIVRIARIGALLSELESVLDYDGLLLNGSTSNVFLNVSEVPVLEEVVVNASD